jgi:nucleolar protein 58
MARMVATKAALSIRVDALSDADSKSSVDAASIGIENRAKLESRLRALEYRNDLTTTTPFKGVKKEEQPKFEMKTDVKQYNTAADAVGFLPTQRQGAEALAINAVLDVKEEKRREKEEKKRAKEEKRRRKAEAAADANAAIEEGPGSEPKDGMSFACDPVMHLTYALDAIPVPMETEQERKERKKLKKEKKRAEAAVAADAAIAAAIAPTSNRHVEASEKKKSKKRKHDEDEMEVDGEKKKKKRRKE